MATNPYLIELPDANTMPSRTLLNGVSAMAVNAESHADAVAIAKAQSGIDVDAMWDAASISDATAAANMNGWQFRLRVVSPAGVTVVDETVSADGTTTGFVAATGTLTSSANYGNGETVTIGTKVYTFQTTLTDVDGHVQIGLNEASSIANLAAAINNDGTAGSQYAASNTANTNVTAVSDGIHVLTATAIVPGSAANSVATTTTAVAAAWANATLTGGVGAVDLLSGLAEKMVAALNATSVIAGAAFNDGTHTLTVAAGSDAIGDHRLFGYFIPTGADTTELIGVPGFISSQTDNGLGSAALSMVLAADTYTVPTVIATLGAGV